MPTKTTAQWEKARVEAPDATFEMAIAEADLTSNTVTIKDRHHRVVATYQLTDVSFETQRGSEVLRGQTEIGPVEVKPDRRCTCVGYKRSVK